MRRLSMSRCAENAIKKPLPKTNAMLFQRTYLKTNNPMQKEITFSTFIRWAGTVLLIGAVLGALNYLSDVLMPFFVAWLFAYLLYPIVKFIENRLHIRFRPLSIILTLFPDFPAGIGIQSHAKPVYFFILYG